MTFPCGNRWASVARPTAQGCASDKGRWGWTSRLMEALDCIPSTEKSQFSSKICK